MNRELQDIQVWKRGKWKKTKGYVIESDLCKYPLCNRKIPSKRAKLPNFRRGYPNTYCSKDHWDAHRHNAHLKHKLNDFIKETV